MIKSILLQAQPPTETHWCSDYWRYFLAGWVERSLICTTFSLQITVLLLCLTDDRVSSKLSRFQPYHFLQGKGGDFTIAISVFLCLRNATPHWYTFETDATAPVTHKASSHTGYCFELSTKLWLDGAQQDLPFNEFIQVLEVFFHCDKTLRYLKLTSKGCLARVCIKCSNMTESNITCSTIQRAAVPSNGLFTECHTPSSNTPQTNVHYSSCTLREENCIYQVSIIRCQQSVRLGIGWGPEQ